MIMRKIRLLFLISLLTSCSGSHTSSTQLRIPHSDLSGPIPPHVATTNTIDSQLFDTDSKKACIRLLESNLYSNNPQVVLSTLYSYSLLQLALPENAVDKLLNEGHPYIQAQLLLTLFETESPESIKAFERAMQSDYPLIQLLGARYLAKNKTAFALSRIESLEAKLPEDFLPYIAELYAIVGSPQAELHIKKLISSGTSSTLSQCLCLIRIYQLMELYPVLSSFKPMNSQEEEALAFALSSLQTVASKIELEKLSHNSNPSVAIQALYSMNGSGYNSSINEYKKLIDTHSPFAFSMLDKTSFSTEEIASLWECDLDWSARFGLALALLERHSNVSLPFLFQTLYESENALYEKTYSLSGTCFAITRSSKPEGHIKSNLGREYESLSLVEMLIRKIELTFPKEFEEFARASLEKGPLSLSPSIIAALSENPSEERTEIIRSAAKTPGQPFIRKLAFFSLIQQNEIPLDPIPVQALLVNLRESLQTLLRQRSLFSLFRKSQSEKELQLMSEQQKLYFAAIAMLAQTKTEGSSRVLKQELQDSREEYRPLIAAALLHSLL